MVSDRYADRTKHPPFKTSAVSAASAAFAFNSTWSRSPKAQAPFKVNEATFKFVALDRENQPRLIEPTATAPLRRRACC